jgi:CheY-like chemotaxis protein
LLLVDDEPDMLDVLAEVLEGEYEIVRAQSAAEALEQVERSRPIQLLIVDFMMPGDDGLTLVRSLRERGHALPVILYSAYLDSLPGEWVGAFRLKVITKGESMEVVEAAIRELIGAEVA